MKVSTAIKYLSELPLDAEICAQWYDQDDMTPMTDTDEPSLTKDEWELAVAIFNKYEFPDMMYLIEEAIREAKQRLAKEKQ